MAQLPAKNPANAWLVDAFNQEIQNRKENEQAGFKRYIEFLTMRAEAKVTLDTIPDCYDASNHTPGYYGASVYYAWCRCGGKRPAYFLMLRDNGWKHIYTRYKKEEEEKAKKKPKKSKRNRQSKSNQRTANKQQHEKIPPKAATSFSDIFHEKWTKFEQYAADTTISAKSIKKYLNKAENRNPKISKDMQCLLAVSYQWKYFANLYKTIEVEEVRYFGGIFFGDDFDKTHPFSDTRPYALLKERTDEAGGYTIDEEWMELFDVWIGWGQNKLHKRIKERVDLQIQKNDEASDSEAEQKKEVENKREKKMENPSKNANSMEHINENELENVNENENELENVNENQNALENVNKNEVCGDADINTMCSDVNIVLETKAVEALVKEQVTFEELQELLEDGTLDQYMSNQLFLNAIQRKRITKYMHEIKKK